MVYYLHDEYQWRRDLLIVAGADPDKLDERTAALFAPPASARPARGRARSAEIAALLDEGGAS